MCGIYGIYRTTGSNHSDAALVERMATCLDHRGPDGYGTWGDERLHFGAGRLAIIDLSAPAGPLFNEDRSVAVVFNGEIYNYRSLRDTLTSQGHTFATHTDGEVIVHGYEQWGRGILEQIHGMFAIAVYDSHDGSILIARDRLGEKPLYFIHEQQPDSNRLLFASEIKALYMDSALRPRVNAQAVVPYMMLGYTPPDMTLFEGIHKLSPGEYLSLNPTASHLQTGLYYTPQPIIPTPVAAKTYDQAVAHTRRLLDEAVEKRLMSDVPLGAFLSGGVDSTAIVGLMARKMTRPVQTFTVGFANHGYKFNIDAHYAQIASQALKTDHHVIEIAENEQLYNALPGLIYALDEPIAQPAIIQTAYVSALARRHGVPVLLSGDGGDELFAGYTTYRADRNLEQYLQIPALIRRLLTDQLIDQLPSRFDSMKKMVEKSRDVDPVARYLGWMNWTTQAQQIELLCRDKREQIESGFTLIDRYLRPKLNQSRSEYFADRIAYTSLRTWLAEDSNMRVDKMSMAMSIEARAPFEDHTLTEWALSLPLSYKLGGGRFKRVLKDAVRDLVPAEILTRPKWGFFPPISNWLRTIFKPYIDRFLSRDYVEHVGWFDPDAVARTIDSHVVRREYQMQPLWMLLQFHMWHAIMIDGSFTLDRKLTPDDL